MTNLPAVAAARSLMEPRSLEEAFRFAEYLADSTMVPRDFQGKPGNVLVALQWGRELGLAPLQALQSVAVINGRPSIWGDAALALVRGSGELEEIEEGTRGEGEELEGFCRVRRRGAKLKETTFSKAQAIAAGLWGKKGRDGQSTPWITYPARMLMLRARGFALRDEFTDVLRGIVTTEEAMDTPAEPRDVPNLDLERGPIQAARGSLLETAAAVTGRELHPRPPPPPEEEPLPLLDPSGKLLEIRRGAKSGAAPIVLWVHTARRMLLTLPTREAVHTWQRENAANFASVGSLYPGEVLDVEDAIDRRLEELLAAPVAKPEEDPPA